MIADKLLELATWWLLSGTAILGLDRAANNDGW